MAVFILNSRFNPFFEHNNQLTCLFLWVVFLFFFQLHFDLIYTLINVFSWQRTHSPKTTLCCCCFLVCLLLVCCCCLFFVSFVSCFCFTPEKLLAATLFRGGNQAGVNLSNGAWILERKRTFEINPLERKNNN